MQRSPYACNLSSYIFLACDELTNFISAVDMLNLCATSREVMLLLKFTVEQRIFFCNPFDFAVKKWHPHKAIIDTFKFFRMKIKCFECPLANNTYCFDNCTIFKTIHPSVRHIVLKDLFPFAVCTLSYSCLPHSLVSIKTECALVAPRRIATDIRRVYVGSLPLTLKSIKLESDRDVVEVFDTSLTDDQLKVQSFDKRSHINVMLPALKSLTMTVSHDICKLTWSALPPLKKLVLSSSSKSAYCGNINAVNLPEHLEVLRLCDCVGTIESLPACLKKLFIRRADSILELPVGLECIDVNVSNDTCLLPETIRSISINHGAFLKLKNIPPALLSLVVRPDETLCYPPLVFPHTAVLKSLEHFGGFVEDGLWNILPDHLISLKLKVPPTSFSHSTAHFCKKLPQKLKKLKFSLHIPMQTLFSEITPLLVSYDSLPPSITCLTFPFDFNSPVKDLLQSLSNLVRLKFGSRFCQDATSLPQSVFVIEKTNGVIDDNVFINHDQFYFYTNNKWSGMGHTLVIKRSLKNIIFQNSGPMYDAEMHKNAAVFQISAP